MKKTSWDDDSVQASGGDDFNERQFSLVAGQKEIIRIVGSPVKFKRYYLKEKNQYIIPEEGDKTLDKRGYKGRECWATKILHIASVKGKKVTKVGMLKIWIFADPNKYITFRELKENYGEFKKYEIALTCTDTKFQRLGAANAILKKSKWLMDKDMMEDVKENKGLLEKMISPKSKKEIEEILEDVDDVVDDDMVEEEEMGSKKKKKKDKKKKKKKKKAEEEEEDEDEIEDELEDEDEEEDEKEEEEDEDEDEDEDEIDDDIDNLLQG